MSDVRKVVLAYSGGLDTSAIVPWLKEIYHCEVVCFAADVGQGEELDPLHEKAKSSGASKCVIRDLKREFVEDYVWPCLRADAVYENKYLLATSMARPLIAKHQMLVAAEEGADAVAHGATGKGNDQVRFELTYKHFDPAIRIIAPWRDPQWKIRSRSDALAYCKKHNVPVTATADKMYSMDRNLWHQSIEGGILEDPWAEPPADCFVDTVSPQEAPDEARYLVVGFEHGTPVSLDGKRMDGVALIGELNGLGAAHGVGRVDLCENRLVGMKSRGVYECPAATILHAAHRGLLELCLDRETYHYRLQVQPKYAELVYNGQWFTPLKDALDAFFRQVEEPVTGEVRVRLYKGSCVVAGRRSPNSLYDPELSTFERDEVYRQADATGFINLFGLPLAVAARLRRRQEQ